MSEKKDLSAPVTVGPYTLPNRVAMAPMTRNRAAMKGVPTPLMTTYYTQRASAGLIVTEGSQVSPQAVGYPATPGIHEGEQVEGWKSITDAVHDKGGRIFLQLWHTGRVSHPSYHEGQPPVAPSAIAPKGEAATYEGMKPFVTPRALETEELPGVVDQFRNGARNAMEAGFDGVEIHGANGYLLDQFLRDGTNKRADRYGGSIENRARLHLEVAGTVCDVWGSGRVAMRLSPSGTFNDMSDSDPKATFGYLVEQLNSFDLAYLHIVNAMEGDIRHGGDALPIGFFRETYKGVLMSNGDYDRESGNDAISSGEADLVSYARLFISNPDLPARFKEGAGLNPPDPATFYGGDEKGYTDYPALG